MLRIISDVHGNIADYKQIIAECEHSLQIGDLAFDYEFLGEIDHEKHKIIAGNHDNHFEKYRYPHFLRQYGVAEHGGVTFFFLEGGFSIDRALRIEREQQQIWPQTYWENEELPQEVLEDAVRVYKDCRPDILISHEPSRTLAKKLGNDNFVQSWGFEPSTFTTRTGEALERMIAGHAPKMHIFGHFHVNYDEVLDGTRYICQEELGYLDLEYFPKVSNRYLLRKYSYHSGVELI